MTDFVNRALFGVASAPGTGNIAVGAAVAGPYRTLGAAQDGMTFDVAITDGNAWEVRTGCVYTHGTTTLTRGTLEDSSTGSAISLSASAHVMVTSTAGKSKSLEWQIDSGYTLIQTSASQSFANNSVVKISSALNLASINPKGWWDAANTRFLPSRAGIYQVICNVQLTSGTSSSSAKLAIGFRKNGAGDAFPAEVGIWGTGSYDPLAISSMIYNLNGSTDYVEAIVFQNTGGSRTSASDTPSRVQFQAYYLGAA